MTVFAELDPPYSTIVADPPWHYAAAWHGGGSRQWTNRRIPLGYSTLSVPDIAALDVAGLAASDAHLYLWTTNRYLADAFGVLDAWGFRLSQTLVWCKPTEGGIGPGGAFHSNVEFCLFARRGKPDAARRIDSAWHVWPKTPHSTKPAAFMDMVEQVSPGPYVELFSRAPRLGWDSWGLGYEIGEAS